MSATDLHERLASLLDAEPDLNDYVPAAVVRGTRRRRVHRVMEGFSAAALVGTLAVALPVSPLNRAIVEAVRPPGHCVQADLSVTFYDNAVHVRNISADTCRFRGEHPVALAVDVQPDQITARTGPHGEPTAYQTLWPGAVYLQPYSISRNPDCRTTLRPFGAVVTYAAVEGRLFPLQAHLQDVVFCAQLRALTPHVYPELAPPSCTVFDALATLNTWTLWVEFGNTEPCRLSGRYPITLVADPEATNIQLTPAGRAPSGPLPAHKALLQPFSVQTVNGCRHGFHMVDVYARVENQLYRVDGPPPDWSGFFTCRIWTPEPPRIEP